MLSLPVVAAVGDALKLGQANNADAVTSLSGSSAASLRITNNRADSPALDLRVVAGSSPFKVGSTVKVRYLNADLLDGKHMGFFAPATHNHDTSYLPIGGKAADADRLDGLNSTAFVQRGLRCAPGATLEGVAADGVAMCSRDYGSRMVDPGSDLLIDGELFGGVKDPDLDPDGYYPLIAFWHHPSGTVPATGKVYVTQCDDLNCAGTEPASVVDPAVATTTGVPSPHVRVAIYGGPIFAYYHYTAAGGALRVASCTDQFCTGGATILPLVTGGNPFPWGLAVNPTNFHIYVLYGDTGGLWFKDCDSTLFVGGSCTTTIIDNQGTEGSLFVQAGSTPIVAYHDTGDHKVYTWSPGGTPKLIATAGANPGATAIARAPSGWPVVAYRIAPDPVVGTGDVMVVQCSAADCSAKSSPRLVSLDGRSDGDIAMVVNDGLPVVAWVGGGGRTFIARCSAADCSGTVTQTEIGTAFLGQIGFSLKDGFAVLVASDGYLTIGALRL
jgi:hypothetical protein